MEGGAVEVEPPQGGPSADGDGVERWSRGLAEALASMPRDLAEAILASLPPDVVERILEVVATRDPYVRLALMALRGCRR